MATEELKKESQVQGPELQERQKIENPEELLQKSLNGKLSQFGGFQLIKGFIKGADNMDPKRKAFKNVFLKESVYKKDREQLKKELEEWISILKGDETQPSVLVGSCEEKMQKAKECLSTNLKKVHEDIQQLEITYRTLDAFFANAGHGEVNCLTLMNVNKEKLKIHDSDDTLAVIDELEKYYDRLNLKNNYSLLVMPGYLGDADNVRKWAKIAYDNKVLMVTDFQDCVDFKDLKKRIEGANLQGEEKELGQVIMTCNYVLGRKKSELANEDDDVYIPASGALAGRLSDTESISISQGVAGMKYGTLSNVKGARLDLRKAQIGALVDLGVTPMVEEDGRTMAFSNRSLYNGGTIGLQEYPIVRVFDWIGKVIQSFFNKQAFIGWTPQLQKELKNTIEDFLNDYKNGRDGCEVLIKDFKIHRLEQNAKKDIDINIELVPIFAPKNFFITLTGQNNSGGAEWKQDVDSK